MDPVTIMAAHETHLIDQQIAWASQPFGDAASLRQREAAAQLLLAQGAAAQQRIIELLRLGRASNPPALIALLPRFGREDAIPLLQELVAGGSGPGLLGAAAEALAQHPSPQAARVLLDALASPRTPTIVAAADALGARGEALARAPLRDLRRHADTAVRYHAVQAAHRLGALSIDDLADIGQHDSDAAVRALAVSLRGGRALGDPP
jgi:HEAT repeat protein